MTEFRRTTPFVRAVVLSGAVAVSMAGVQLYLLTDHTERLFAWTIAVPLSATFLGAFYLTAVPLALHSARAPTWAQARLPVPGVLVFLWVTLATSLLHLSKFHLHSTDAVARWAAILWVAIYVLDPPVLTAALLLQLRAPGEDPPRTHPLPHAFRTALGVYGAGLLFVGVALFAGPNWTARWWPWSLTPLTARAMSAWVLTIAVMFAQAVWENDWSRIRRGVRTVALLAALQLLAVARYRAAVDWSPRGWIYVAVLLGAAAISAFGWMGSQSPAPNASVRGTASDRQA